MPFRTALCRPVPMRRIVSRRHLVGMDGASVRNRVERCCTVWTEVVGRAGIEPATPWLKVARPVCGYGAICAR